MGLGFNVHALVALGVVAVADAAVRLQVYGRMAVTLSQVDMHQCPATALNAALSQGSKWTSEAL